MALRSVIRQQKRWLGIGVVLFFLTACLMGCQPESSQTEEAPVEVVKIGTIEGPETALIEVAKEVAKRDSNLRVEIVTFTDYNLPNVALNEGSLDANMFQHQPYLDAAIKAHQYQISSIGKTFIYPMAIYSKKHNQLHNLPEGAVIAIPNDPSNEARALLLLQKAGLITLRREDFDVTPLDISENLRNFQFKELDAAQLTRALEDVDLAVINTNYAVAAGLMPKRDGLFLEDTHSPYANIVVVKTIDRDHPKFQHLLNALHSPEVENKAHELFQGQAIPAWR